MLDRRRAERGESPLEFGRQPVRGAVEILNQREPKSRVLRNGLAEPDMALGCGFWAGQRRLRLGDAALHGRGNAGKGHKLHRQRRGGVELGPLISNSTHDFPETSSQSNRVKLEIAGDRLPCVPGRFVIARRFLDLLTGSSRDYRKSARTSCGAESAMLS